MNEQDDDFTLVSEKRLRSLLRIEAGLMVAKEALEKFVFPRGTTCNETQYAHDQIASTALARISEVSE